MRLKHAVERSVSQARLGDFEALKNLVFQEPRCIRHFVGMSYHPDPQKRQLAAEALAIASRHHPGLIQEVVRRLVWAMNDESATNALTAPGVLAAIARVSPRLLLPFVPDLTRLSSDAGLHAGLKSTLEQVRAACPGEVGRSIGTALRKRINRETRTAG